MKVMALDFGSARTGVAVSDPTGSLARPLCVVERAASEAGLARIRELIRDEGAERVVVGLPLSLDGTEGQAAQAARAEAESLAGAVGVPVETHDERLTSVSAGRSLAGSGLPSRARRRARRGSVDKVAAAIMLQSWLDARAGRGNPDE